MNIVINAVLAFEQPRGVGRYVNNLLPALAEIDPENEYYIYYGKWMKKYEFLKIKKANFHFIELDIKNSMIARNYYLAVNLPINCRKYNPDILFLVDTQAIIVKPSNTCKIVSTIHDLAEFVVPEKYSAKQAFIRRMIVKHQVKVSTQIMTVSNYSKSDICTRFNISKNRVSVVYNSAEPPLKTTLEKPGDFFLYVSEIERAKNLATLLKAYSKLPNTIKNKYMIYIVGKKGNDYDNVLSIIHSLGIKDRIKLFGFVSDDELASLYSKAYCFIFPSVFEGFGLPVLEAMGKGTPVLCSNSSSIPEVGGDAVLTFDPYNPDDISKQIVKLIDSEGLRASMIEKGLKRAAMFSKEAQAQKTLEVFKSVRR